MTDKEKLDALRAEIHRLVDVRGYDREMANDLFAFMDSLPNEPKDKCQGCNNVKGCVTCVDGSEWAHIEEPNIPSVFDEGYWERLVKEPVSKNLEEEIAKFNDNYFPETDNGLNIEMRKELRTIVGEAAKMGAQWKKKQIMKDAKSGIGNNDNYIQFKDGTWIDLDPSMLLKPAFNVKEGEKVKVIIIKDE